MHASIDLEGRRKAASRLQLTSAPGKTDVYAYHADDEADELLILFPSVQTPHAKRLLRSTCHEMA